MHGSLLGSDVVVLASDTVRRSGVGCHGLPWLRSTGDGSGDMWNSVESQLLKRDFEGNTPLHTAA